MNCVLEGTLNFLHQMFALIPDQPSFYNERTWWYALCDRRNEPSWLIWNLPQLSSPAFISPYLKLPKEERDPNPINTPHVKICKRIQSLGLQYIFSSVSSIYPVVLAVGSFNQIPYKKRIIQSLLTYFDINTSEDIIWGIQEYILLKPFVLHSGKLTYFKSFIFIKCFPEIIVMIDKLKTIKEEKPQLF